MTQDTTTTQEFQPMPALDFTDQSVMLMALEELGIATMQNVWIQTNDPEHADAAAIAEQAGAFLLDLTTLLSNPADGVRAVDNGWTGPKLVAHIKAALASEGLSQTDDDETTVANALSLYIEDLKVLVAFDQHEKTMNRQTEPKLYIDLMRSWSGIFSGKETALERPLSLSMFRATQRR